MTTTSTKLRPRGNRVLVKRKEAQEKQIGGIILPDSANAKQDIGVVLATGPGKKDKDGAVIEISVKTGDTIMWDKYGGQEITIDEEEFIMVKSDDIIAIVE